MNQSMWHTGGQNAARIHDLAILFGLLLGTIFLMVIAVALLSLTRRHPATENESIEHTHRPASWTEAKLRRAVIIASGVTVLILLGLIVVSVSVGKSVSRST